MIATGFSEGGCYGGKPGAGAGAVCCCFSLNVSFDNGN